MKKSNTKKAPNPKMTAGALRKTAEKRFKEENIARGWPKTEEDILRLVYELEVHQLELKLQNEQLEWAKEELDAKAERYFELYEFAPVGYIIFTYEGVITSINLAGANLLGSERSRLIGRHVQRLLASEYESDFNQLLKKAIASEDKQICDLALPKVAGPQSFVRIEVKASKQKKEFWAVIYNFARS